MRAVAAALVVALITVGSAAPAMPVPAPAPAPPIGHVFLIVLENRGFDTTWGDPPGAPYLATDLRAQGTLLTQYFATSHHSLGNYLTLVSGQPATATGKADCAPPTRFGACTFPASTKTVADQLSEAGLTWRGYMEDMATPCRHPDDGAVDTEQAATAASQYATRHNPFVYFHSITDDAASCATHVVGLDALAGDLATVASTPNLAFITPDLCHDGHDATCPDGTAGGYRGIDDLLRTVVPEIEASPAYQRDGLLLITFDEAEGDDAEACCYQPEPSAGITGPGGGRVGLLAIAPWMTPGAQSDVPYNHFSLLRTIDDVFGLAPLAGAGDPATTAFGPDVLGVSTAASTGGTTTTTTTTTTTATTSPGASTTKRSVSVTAVALFAALVLLVGVLGRRTIRRGSGA